MNNQSFQRTCLAVLLSLAFGLLASAQQATPPGGSTGGTGGNSRRDIPPARPIQPQPQPQPGNQSPQLSMPSQIFIFGRVVRDDGSAPPYGAVIELNCGGIITREAIVGSNGQFSFQFGGENRFAQVFPDASQGYDPPIGDSELSQGASSRSGAYSGESQRQRNRKMIGCEMRAQLSGYRSTALTIVEEPLHGTNDVGTVVLYPAERVQGSLVSVTNLLVPKSARKSAENAKKAVQKQKPAEAEGLFRAAIHEYPKFAEAWFDLGALYEKQGRIDEARNAYREAMKADTLYLRPYIRLAQIAAAGRNWREASDLVDKALDLDSFNVLEAYMISAIAHFSLSELEISEKRARQGLRMDFSHRYPQLALVLANICAIRRDSTGYMRELRNYLKLAPNAPDASLVRAKIQKLEEDATRSTAIQP